MKKVLITLMATLMVFSLLVSCAPEETGLVRVIFKAPTASKAIGASLDPYTASEIYWTYTAVKTDGGPATHAVTVQAPVNADSNSECAAGFSSSTVGPFDVGDWTFTFYGYKTKAQADANIGKNDGAATNVLYKGSTNETLSSGRTTAITVVAIHQGKTSGTWGTGNIVIDEVYISNNGSVVTAGSTTMDVTLECLSKQDGDINYSDIAHASNKFSKASTAITEGVYLASFDFKNGSTSVASVDDIVVIIIDGKTTTISGNLEQVKSQQLGVSIGVEHLIVFDNYYIVVLSDAQKDDPATVAAANTAAENAAKAESVKSGNETKTYVSVDADGTQHSWKNGAAL